ncbi:MULTISPECIES: fimbrial protein YehD [Pseudescherichia]|jgi:type 1 fimbria pilin|uniref:fimbrial protein YehD n=1 Tax=Pseudescherichia TaxID=2055880 RepID=UPI00289EF6A4|nr:fimbrial protein YehD [Pseudescherichia sp.]
MKRTLITAAILAASCAAPAAFAADTDAGTLTINGVIKGTTCHFESGAQTAHINMQQIGTDSLEALTQGGAYDGYQNKTATSFKVKCAAGTEAPKLKFLADQFDVTGANSVTKNQGDAAGVGYALLINGQRIDSDGSTAIANAKNDNGEYTFDIAAQYARASGEQVTAGSVNSTVTLTVVVD